MTHPTHKQLPRVPTDEMLNAGRRIKVMDEFGDYYCASLSIGEVAAMYQAMYDAYPVTQEVSGLSADSVKESSPAPEPSTHSCTDFDMAIHNHGMKIHLSKGGVNSPESLKFPRPNPPAPMGLTPSGECVKKVNTSIKMGCEYERPSFSIDSPEPTKETPEEYWKKSEVAYALRKEANDWQDKYHARNSEYIALTTERDALTAANAELVEAWSRYMADCRPETRNDFLRVCRRVLGETLAKHEFNSSETNSTTVQKPSERGGA